MAVEYVTALAFTIVAALTFGQAVGPAVENYRATLQAENTKGRRRAS
jgi:hypothetical protein